MGTMERVAGFKRADGSYARGFTARGGASTRAVSDALAHTKVHPGYRAAYTPAENYRIGREHGRNAREIVEEMNALYVLNANHHPTQAARWRASRNYASKRLREMS